MNFKSIFNEIKNFPSEIIEDLRQRRKEEVEASYNEGYDDCLTNTVTILIDINLKDTEIIEILQKHFDVRKSEAERMIEFAKNS